MYEFVSKKELTLAKLAIVPIILKVQKELRKKKIITFQYNLIGSANKHKHLVTREINGNQGFDLDYNLILNLKNPNEDPKKIKQIFMETFNKYLPKEKGFKCCEDSSSVFTIKKIDTNTSKIIYSFDFAIIRYEKSSEEIESFISFNKHNETYFWEERQPIYTDIMTKQRCIKRKKFWGVLRKTYLKNKNSQPTKKSRIIYYETLNQIYKKYCR